MQRKPLGHLACPVARTLDIVGDWWSILILRDALHGVTRFDEFLNALEIAPNMLTRRLKSLVEHGMLERHQYTDRPPRFEYRLTERGRDFEPVLQTLLAWGNRHLAPEGASVVYAHSETGAVAEPVVVDRLTGRSMQAGYAPAPGPAANDAVLRKIAVRQKEPSQ